MFLAFPGGGAGVGLLLLRLSVAGSFTATLLGSGDVPAWMLFLAILVSIGLCAGFLARLLRTRLRRRNGNPAFIIAPDRQIPQNAIGQLQIALEFFNNPSRRAVSQEGIVASPLLFDVVRKVSHAPVIHLGDDSFLPLDHFFESVDEFFGSSRLLGMNHE